MALGRKTGGRAKGTPNKATADIKAAASQYGERALQTLVDIATTGESEAARVAAANAILDRAYGKPKQSVEATGADGTPLLPALKVTFA